MAGLDVYVGGRFEVLRNGSRLPSPPTVATAALLIELAFRPGAQFGRRSLSERLHPDSTAPQTAFRQTLKRLKDWIGKEFVEADSDRVSLRPGTCQLHFELIDGGITPSTLIAPGIDHALVEAIREELDPKMILPEVHGLDQYAIGVEAVSQIDRSAGREVLIGGSRLHSALPTQVMRRLLLLTAPETNEDSLACRHHEVSAWFWYRNGSLLHALDAFLKAIKVARLAGDRDTAFRAQAYTVFLFLELNQIERAMVQLTRLPKNGVSRDNRLLALNAEAMANWNQGAPQRALEKMSNNMEFACSCSRTPFVHFATNLAVLSAQLGHDDVFNVAMDAAKSQIVRDLDCHDWMLTELALAERLSVAKDYERAKAILQELERSARERAWLMLATYAAEALADVLAHLGEVGAARAAIVRAEKWRVRSGFGLNPRITARMDRVVKLL